MRIGLIIVIVISLVLVPLAFTAKTKSRTTGTLGNKAASLAISYLDKYFTTTKYPTVTDIDLKFFYEITYKTNNACYIYSNKTNPPTTKSTLFPSSRPPRVSNPLLKELTVNTVTNLYPLVPGDIVVNGYSIVGIVTGTDTTGSINVVAFLGGNPKYKLTKYVMGYFVTLGNNNLNYGNMRAFRPLCTSY